MKNEIAEVREPHALDEIQVLPSSNNWNEQLAKWEKPMTFEDRISWLHTNHVRNGNGPERFIFYLELADRYGESEVFSVLPDHCGSESSIFTAGSYSSKGGLKTKISVKAFTILCTHFFAEDASPCPIDLPYKEPLFSKLLWFFRPFGGDGGWDNLRTYNSSRLGKDDGAHYLDVAKGYAMQFVINAWSLLNGKWFLIEDCPPPDSKMVKSHWKEIVALIRHLDLLSIIEYGQYLPTPEVFKKMVRFVLNAEGIGVNEEVLGDASFVGTVLEPFVRKGNKLARVLYVARLNVLKKQ
jgi:hypothetical protein